MSSKASRGGLLHRMAEKFGTFFNRPESPREVQERKDLYMAILASTYKSLRLQKTPNVSDPTISNSSSASHLISILKQMEKKEKSVLVEEATQTLEDQLVPQMTILELRQFLQKNLAYETKQIFQAFSTAEQKMLSDKSRYPKAKIGGHHKLNKQNKDEEKMKPILLQDFDAVSNEVFKANPALPLHMTKLGAVKTLLDYKNWVFPSSKMNKSKILSESSQNDKISMNETDNSHMDEFGYYSMDDNAEIKHIMRNNHIINMCYSHLIKEILGYSTLTLRSTIPNAGRGIFVDGFACAGSIVAFFPGEVWPRENLQNQSIASHFAEDDNFQLSLRYDDILIDSRKSPAVVLDTESSNPWAIAHLANHPPKPKSKHARKKKPNLPKQIPRLPLFP